MNILVPQMTSGLLAVLFSAVMTGFAGTLPDLRNGATEKLAIVPFEVKGLSKEECVLLTERFATALAETKRYEIMSQKEMDTIIRESDFKNLEACNYSLCLADLGKVLGVPKVLHGSIGRRGKSYTVRIRLIDVEKAEIIYDERSEHSGEFDLLASDVIPQQARDLGGKRFDSGGKWFVIAAAVLVTLGTIYTVYKVFTKNAGGDEGGGGIPPTPQ